MKNLLKFPNYFLLMIIAELIYILKLRSIFSMNAIAILLFNYLAIKFTIKIPLERNKNLTKKDIYKPLLIVSSIIITICSFPSNFLSNSEVETFQLSIIESNTFFSK